MDTDKKAGLIGLAILTGFFVEIILIVTWNYWFPLG